MAGPDPARETGLLGGAETRAIVVVPYRTEWPALFRRHAERIAAALGEAALRIEHIGSTAVPGLAAKPIIDMLVVVEDSAEEGAYRSHESERPMKVLWELERPMPGWLYQTGKVVAG